MLSTAGLNDKPAVPLNKQDPTVCYINRSLPGVSDVGPSGSADQHSTEPDGSANHSRNPPPSAHVDYMLKCQQSKQHSSPVGQQASLHSSVPAPASFAAAEQPMPCKQPPDQAGAHYAQAEGCRVAVTGGSAGCLAAGAMGPTAAHVLPPTAPPSRTRAQHNTSTLHGEFGQCLC